MNTPTTLRQALRQLLLLSAIIKNKARWEFFPNSTTEGEICIDGLRHTSMLDESGNPIVTDNVYAALKRIMN